MDAFKPVTGEETVMQDAFLRLRAAARKQAFPELAERRRWLTALERLIKDNRQPLIAAVSADFGHRSDVETRLGELFPSLEGIRHAQRHLARWMRPQRRKASIWFMPARNRVIPQPLGVVGVIVPWNYPLFLAFGPLVAALAAGNRVMVKMSELTPATGELLRELCERYFGPDLVTVVNGGPELAQAFTCLPFDHLLFTGSTAIGKHVMRAAADNLTPVTLELGGKSPTLVAPGADVSLAAESIVAGKMFNAGQTCVAPDYVLVQEKERDRLVAALEGAASKAHPQLRDSSAYSNIINQRHYQRLQGWLDEARAAGAAVRQINPAGEALDGVRKLPLTLVLDCPDEVRLMQEEIFGPILPVVSYRTFAEALDYINNRPRPLALYLFDTDEKRIEQTLRDTISGGVAINDTLLQVAQDDMPFGGVGPSGMGHYHGPEGFLTFSKLKPVFEQSRLSGAPMTRAPYGRRIEWLLKLMMGR